MRFAWMLAVATVVGCNVDTTSNTSGMTLVPHCEDLQGNVTCQTAFAGRPFCSRCVEKEDHQGCVAAAPAPVCQVGGTATESTHSTGEPEESSTSADTSSSSTTEPVADNSTGSSSSSTGETIACNEEGQLDEDCEAIDVARAYCFESQCVGCVEAGGDAFCTAFDPDVPFCNPGTDRCETCANAGAGFCTGTAPICTDGGACAPCSEHAECPDTACHIAPTDPLVGECFDPVNVVWVNGNSICPGLGTEAAPACSLAQALSTFLPGESWVVHVVGANYDEHVVAADATVALIGQGAVSLLGEPGLDDGSLSIEGGFVYLQGVRVRDNLESHGVVCSGGGLWMDQSEVRENAEYGIFLTSPCDITVRRASVHDNLGGGIRQLGGTLRLDNAAIGGNGDGVSGPGINAQYSEIDILYSTIVGNDGVGEDSIHCLDATGTVRNSIVQGVATDSVDIDCFVFDFSTNAIDTAAFVGADGVPVDAYDPQWFVNPDEGDFRLVNPSFTQFGDVAVWVDGDPPNDVDGTMRPVGGELGFAGVDEP